MSNFKIAKQLPFDVLVKRIIKKIIPSKKIDYLAQEFRKSTSNLELNALLDSSKFEPETSKDRIEHYLNHEFDLLGSGWVSRNAGKAKQVHSNHQKTTQEIASLIDENYQIINWQKDVKTIYEYDVAKAFYNQNTPKGVDIKDLWELGRLQHLPQLAFASKKQEFRNQCLDFIAYNPIGMGVQWACTMDVGIRVCNMLLAYDILNQDFDEAFKQVFTDSIYQHGQFILNHLEYKEGAAGNHYLFNLVGLLFISNYFIENEEIKQLRFFAEDELEKEFFKQFFNDGGNFEGSTTYHCLSAEAILYGTALMLRSGRELSKSFKDLFFKSAAFIEDVIKPNGELPQFGDNDSGRLFKLGNEDDNLLNYESIISGFSGLLEKKPKHINSKELVEQLAKRRKIKVNSLPQSNYRLSKPTELKNSEITTIDFHAIINLNEITFFGYFDFGLYGFKSNDFYLAISAISNPKMHHSWGHVHNDKLSFELQVKGKDLVKDPGSYLYTSNPEQRNLYRSAKAHHGIIVEGVEQNKLIDLFYLERETKCELIDFTSNSIVLKASYYGVKHIRKFEIKKDKLVITDSCNKPFKVNINQFKEYSPNYGVKQ